MKVFIEEQRFKQLWIYIILLISFLIPLILVINEISDKGWNEAESKIGFIVIIGTFLLSFGFMFSLKLKTRIDEHGISYRFLPFHFSNRLIKWDEIKEAFVRKYSPISDYGGWGMKGGKLWDKSKGVAYNVSGNIGIQLVLKNGKKILIGTQKERDAINVLVTYENKLISIDSTENIQSEKLIE